MEQRYRRATSSRRPLLACGLLPATALMLTCAPAFADAGDALATTDRTPWLSTTGWALLMVLGLGLLTMASLEVAREVRLLPANSLRHWRRILEVCFGLALLASSLLPFLTWHAPLLAVGLVVSCLAALIWRVAAPRPRPDDVSWRQSDPGL